MLKTPLCGLGTTPDACDLPCANPCAALRPCVGAPRVPIPPRRTSTFFEASLAACLAPTLARPCAGCVLGATFRQPLRHPCAPLRLCVKPVLPLCAWIACFGPAYSCRPIRGFTALLIWMYYLSYSDNGINRATRGLTGPRGRGAPIIPCRHH